MVPMTYITNSFIEHKEVADPSRYTWVYTEKLSRKVASEDNLPVCTGVKTVVVSWGQVDDTLIQLIVANILQAAAVIAIIIISPSHD